MELQDHPSPESLAAFATGPCGEYEGEIVDHLVACPDCARIVLDLRGDILQPDLEMDAAWERFRAGRGALIEMGAGVRNRRQVLVGVATAVFIAALGCVTVWGFWSSMNARRELVEVRTELNALVEPQANPPSAELLPWKQLRGGREPAVLDFGGGGRIGVLRLVLLEEPASDHLRLVVRDQQGRQAAEVTGLEVDASGNLTAVVHWKWLAPGRYVLRLTGADDASEPLAEYRLLVRSLEKLAE